MSSDRNNVVVDKRLALNLDQFGFTFRISFPYYNTYLHSKQLFWWFKVTQIWVLLLITATGLISRLRVGVSRAVLPCTCVGEYVSHMVRTRQ